MEIIGGCGAPHVKGLQPDHMGIVWLDGGLRAEDRVRVIAWTCDCRETVYELCRSAGQAYIRRTLRQDREVHETYRWTFGEAERVWSALLAGQAR